MTPSMSLPNFSSHFGQGLDKHAPVSYAGLASEDLLLLLLLLLLIGLNVHSNLLRLIGDSGK